MKCVCFRMLYMPAEVSSIDFVIIVQNCQHATVNKGRFEVGVVIPFRFDRIWGNQSFRQWTELACLLSTTFLYTSGLL